MVFITIGEIFDIIIMTVLIGFIFSKYLARYKPISEDPLEELKKSKSYFGVSVEDLKFAAMVVAPGIILHELGHKVVAISFGLSATFNAAYFWLGLGVVLTLINFGFIFFVPAYVSVVGQATHLQSALIAFAGPFVNLVLWLGAHFALKGRWFDKKYNSVLGLTAKINMFLFIFNMLPLFFFDGYKVFNGLFHVLF